MLPHAGWSHRKVYAPGVVVLQIVPMIILGVSIGVGPVKTEAGSSTLSERSPGAKGDEYGFARVCLE
jgi:hypothetical protein